MLYNKLQYWLDTNKEIGILLLRLFIGVRLIYGVIDNVFAWERMVEFKNFIMSQGFPASLLCAILSVYAQLFAGILFIIGYKTRFAAFLMIINFLVAIFMVHRRDSFEGMTPAMAILFSSIMLLFYGAGKISLDYKLAR